MAREWLFLPDAAMPLMLAAVRAYGPRVLSDADADESAGPESVGRDLLRAIFGTGDAGLPDRLAQLIRDPGDERAVDGLTEQASESFEADPGVAGEAVAMIAAFYRSRAARGEVPALVELGDFLYWDDPDGARAAYQEAIDAGHAHALISLAKLLHRLGEEDAALAAYQQAEESDDLDLAAEAAYEIAFVHVSHHDEASAAPILQRVIEAGNATWAPAAMVGLAGIRHRASDDRGAEAMYRAAIETANAGWSANASFCLGELLEGTGETDAAKAQYQRLIEAGDPEWAGSGLMNLVNLLKRQNDADGLRAAYNTGVALGNPETLYALVQLGQVLEHEGDIEGAHAAWRQAIDAGCEDPDYWLERMSPPPPRERSEPAPYPDDLPPEFNPRNMTRTGIEVLERGLPALPETLTYDMAIPVAYWKAEQCAVVLVLQFPQDSPGGTEPMAWQVTYSRAADGSWTPPKGFGGTSFGYDPIACPQGRLDGLDGRAIVHSGGSEAGTVKPGRPVCTAVGHTAPEVKYLALIKDDREDRRELDSHFGAWVACTEIDGSFEVAAIDASGAKLQSMHLP
jgi:tetratricopeptide (TPR) repeat protein